MLYIYILFYFFKLRVSSVLWVVVRGYSCAKNLFVPRRACDENELAGGGLWAPVESPLARIRWVSAELRTTTQSRRVNRPKKVPASFSIGTGYYKDEYLTPFDHSFCTLGFVCVCVRWSISNSKPWWRQSLSQSVFHCLVVLCQVKRVQSHHYTHTPKNKTWLPVLLVSGLVCVCSSKPH